MTTYLYTRRFDGSLSNDLHTDNLNLIPDGHVRVAICGPRFAMLFRRASHEAVASVVHESQGGSEIVAIWIAHQDLDVLWGSTIRDLATCFEESVDEGGQWCSDIIFRGDGAPKWRFRTVRAATGVPLLRSLHGENNAEWDEEMRLDGSRESAAEILEAIRRRALPYAVRRELALERGVL